MAELEKEREISRLLQELINKTRYNTIEWVQSSDAVFLYERRVADGAIRATLQRTNIPPTRRTLTSSSYRYVFTLTSFESGPSRGDTVFIIDTQENGEFLSELDRLFKLIEFQKLHKGLETFKKLLE